METQRHASRILHAWELADWSAYRSAVTDAAEASHRNWNASSLEREKREVLAGVIADLPAVDGTGSPSSRSTSAAFFLMKHLASPFTANRLFLVKKIARQY